MVNELHKCTTCNGAKWVRGLVGGIYECPDCWMHEQMISLDSKAQKIDKKALNKQVDSYLDASFKDTIKPKRKYTLKNKK